MTKCIIFDLDDTLCDYTKAMENAKILVNHELINHGCTDLVNFWIKYHATEPILFKEFTKKLISLETYRLRRYADVLTEFCLTSDAIYLSQILNDIYINTANTKIELFPDAVPTLADLRNKGLLIFVLSNGPSDGQRMKFNALGLENKIDQLYISEEIGRSKPSKESFMHVLNNNRLTVYDSIVVGDSIEYDINGALNAGINAVLLDRNNKHSSFLGEKICSLHELTNLVSRTNLEA